MRYGKHEKKLYGGELDTTNNRMELTAAIEALKALKHPSKVELTTDSVYVKNGINQWLEGWKAKGWKTAAKKPVKNQDLWMAMDEACQRHDITWKWVKGHAGDPGNEKADELARRGTEEARGR